jgi:GYF domain 2
MEIYVYSNNGQRLGPYSEEQVRLALQQGTFRETDKSWASGLADWIDLGAVLKTSRYTCPQCQGVLARQIENPQRSTGIIVMVLGVLLAPFCVGIILIIWGASLIGETKSYWHCRGCGRTYPG